MGLEPVPQGRMLPDQAARPGFVMQPIHLFAGVAQGAMAHVVEQGRGIEHPPVSG